MKEKDISIGLYINKSTRSMREVIAHSDYYSNIEWRNRNSMKSRLCKSSTFAQWADYRVLYLVECLKDYDNGIKTTLRKNRLYPVVAETQVGIMIIDEEGNEQWFALAGSSFVSKVSC